MLALVPSRKHKVFIVWTYEQSSGRIIKEGIGILATGYSGAMGYKNDVMMQNIENKGPIPCGMYRIGAPRDTTTHGPYVLPLEPDHRNEMFGRHSFFIHGDSIERLGFASEGCIVLPKFARERIYESGDHDLQVVKELEMTA